MDMKVERIPGFTTYVSIFVSDGHRHRTIMCRDHDAKRVLEALAECETITEFRKRQQKRYQFNDLFIEMPWYGA